MSTDFASTGRVYRPAARTFAQLGAWISVSMVLWACLWASINTGPWNLGDFGNGLSGDISALRAAMPLFALAAAALWLTGTQRHDRRSWVEIGFWGYGIVMLMACSGAENWFNRAYWGFAFLAALAVTEIGLRNPDPLAFATRLNWASWIVTTFALVAMLFLARDVLLTPSGSAYGVVARFQQANGYTISRSTGLARMAVVPALISLVFMLSGSLRQRALSGIVLIGALYVLWIMQARGAMFAFIGATAFVLLYGPGKWSRTFLVLILAALAFVVMSVAQGTSLGDIWNHITRQQGIEGFATASGRFDIFGNAVAHWLQSPLFGHGPQADRIFADVGNAQNAILYALLSAGIIGALFFVGANLAAGLAVLRVGGALHRMPRHQRRMTQIAAGIFVFSVLRSIPENQAAVFSVDMLLQYPAMIYLVALSTTEYHK